MATRDCNGNARRHSAPDPPSASAPGQEAKTAAFVHEWERAAENHAQNGSWHEVIQCCNQILQIPGQSKTNFHALYLIGVAYMQLGRGFEAFVNLVAARDINPHHEGIHERIRELNQERTRDESVPGPIAVPGQLPRPGGAWNRQDVDPTREAFGRVSDNTVWHTSEAVTPINKSCASTQSLPLEATEQNAKVPSGIKFSTGALIGNYVYGFDMQHGLHRPHAQNVSEAYRMHYLSRAPDGGNTYAANLDRTTTFYGNSNASVPFHSNQTPTFNTHPSTANLGTSDLSRASTDYELQHQYKSTDKIVPNNKQSPIVLNSDSDSESVNRSFKTDIPIEPQQLQLHSDDNQHRQLSESPQLDQNQPAQDEEDDELDKEIVECEERIAQLKKVLDDCESRVALLRSLKLLKEQSGHLESGP